MSLLGLPAQFLDRMLGTTAARPVPDVEQNGHADFSDENEPWLAIKLLRENLAVRTASRDAWRQRARHLGKAYGRASATIGNQRGTIASLHAQLAAALSETPGAACGGAATGTPDHEAAGSPVDGTPAGGAGERPPAGTGFDEWTEQVCDDLAALGLLRLPRETTTVVRVLTDHEMLADDTCRCGWGTRYYTDPPVDPLDAQNPLWHAEHVAMQLAAQGVTGEPIRTRERYVLGSEAATLPVGTVLLLDADRADHPGPVVRGRRGWIDSDNDGGPRDLHQTSRFRVLYQPEVAT